MNIVELVHNVQEYFTPPDTQETPMNSTTTAAPSEVDFPRPSKDVEISEALNNRRLDLVSDPEFTTELQWWVGCSLEGTWNLSVPYKDRIWNKYMAALMSWVLTGADLNAGDCPRDKFDIKEVLVWWAGSPQPIKDLLEPIVTQWKVVCYCTDASWAYSGYSSSTAVKYKFT